MASGFVLKSLTCFGAAVFFIHMQTVTGSGSFQIHLTSLRNIKSVESNGECCDGSREIHRGESVCLDECDTFFRVCLTQYKQYSASSTGPCTRCTYGEYTTFVLGESSIAFTNTSSSNNGFRNPISIRLPSSWRTTYYLVLEAKDADDSSNSELIDRATQRGTLIPSKAWESHTYKGPAATISYKIRVICDTDYYGNRCEKYCRPQNENSSHYTCDKNGNKVCVSGWRGDLCDTDVLDPKGSGRENDKLATQTNQVFWILLGLSIFVFIAVVIASAWFCLKMRKLKGTGSRASATGSRRNIGSLQSRYDVQNEYIVVPDFNCPVHTNA